MLQHLRGMEKAKYRKKLIWHPLAKVFAFNNVNNRPPICFRRKTKLIKLTFTKTEILPGSLPGHCGEADCARVHVVPQPFASGPCAGGGKISGTQERLQLSF